MRHVDVHERRSRLARRHRLLPDSRAETVEEAAAAVVCLHATDPATVYLSAWARVAAPTVTAVDRGLYVDRSLVKHLAMRRTLWVVPRAALSAVQYGASVRVAEAERRRLVRDVEKAGLHAEGARWLDAASEAVLALLADGREATSTELRREIPLLEGGVTYGAGKSWGGEVPVGPRVLTVLSASGELVRASNEGGWTVSRPRWSSMKAWLGAGVEPMPEREARAALVRAWLERFGPGTAKDLTWWLGSTVAAVRTALADVQAVEVQLDDGPGYLLPDDLDAVAPAEPWAALLPGLDPATMGWFDRGWYLGAHRDQVFDRNGNGGPTAWWDGRIVGGWHQTPAGEVVPDLLEELPAQARRALAQEAGRLTDLLAGTRPSARFPSPLSKTAQYGREPGS